MIRSVAALLFLYHQVSMYELYSELKDLGGSCHPRDSCVPARKSEDDHLWGNFTCECGIHCLRYRTCCANSDYVGQSLNFPYRGETCEKLPGFQNWIVQVNRCSDKLRHDNRIRERCERVDEQFDDPVAMTPVTSTKTFVTYKNYFCALCSEDSEDILFWNIGVLSDATGNDLLENLIYDAGRKCWGVEKGGGFHEVKVKFRVPPPLMKFVKKCHRRMISDCSPDHTFNYQLRNKCSSYYAPVKVQEVGGYAKVYRNVHCAICNNLNVSQSDGRSGCLKDFIGRRKPSFSFALLLDINTSDGELVGKKQAACGRNEKWDPFFKKCRYLACALQGYVLRNGECVQI